MGSVSNPALVGNVRKGAMDATWSSLYSLMDFPQYYPELVKKYGKAFDLFDFLTAAGSTGTIAGQTLTLYSKGGPERYVTTHTAIAVKGAGVDIVVEIEEWDTVANGGRPAVAVGEKFAIPGAYCTVSGVKCVNPQWYQIVTIASTTANPNEEDTDITATPLNALTILAVEVPIGTKLFVTGGNYAPGSAGAKSKTSGWYSETFTTGIKRARFDIEGSQVSNELYTHHLAGGGMGQFSDASIEAEFRLDHSINYDILLGDTVDNLTMTNRDSVANSVRGTKGVMPHLNTSGCKIYFTSSFGVSDVENIKKAFISQGVTDTTASLMGGYNFLLGVENNCLDFVKEYSGGSNLLDGLANLKVAFKTIQKGGIMLSLHELSSFSNPNTLGISTYGFSDKAIVIPDTQVTVRDNALSAEVKMQNLKLLYKKYGGEDRTRAFNILPGVNGLSQINGNVAIDGYDSVAAEWLSEFALAFLKINQSILIQPDSVL